MGSPDEPPAGRDGWLSAVGKAAAVAAFFALWYAGYTFFNHWGADPVRAIRITRPYDVWPGLIQPWTAAIYVFAGYAIPLLPFVWNRSWPRVGFVLGAYAISTVIGFTAYWLYPLAIERPPFTGDGWAERLMRGVVEVDHDANCCPSFHTSFAILAALLVARGGAPRPMRVATWVVAVAICVTTITTGQHYFIDVPGGVASALVSYYAMVWLTRRRASG